MEHEQYQLGHASTVRFGSRSHPDDHRLPLPGETVRTRPRTPEELEQEAAEKTRLDAAKARDMVNGLRAGTKYPEDELEWLATYYTAVYFGDNRLVWRNKNHGTLYKFKGIQLRVLDAARDGFGSPVVISVAYTPYDRLNPERRFVFNRTLVEFLTKFEPVYLAENWALDDTALPVFSDGAIMA